jgi:hypothetical protein
MAFLVVNGIQFDELTSDPGSPAEGQSWFNSTDKKLKYYRNGAIDTLVDLTTFNAHANSTSNPHGTTLEQARTSGATLGGSVNFGGYALTSVGAGSAGTDGAQRQWVLDQIKAYLAGLEWQEDVINFTNNPPGTPNTGDRYVITAVASGVWAGKENQIAEWNGTAWEYTIPNEGYSLRDDTANTMMLYSGSAWGNFGNAIDHSVLLNLTSGDPHTQYQQESEKNANSGYCGLTAGGDIDDTRHGSRSGGTLHTVVSSSGAGFAPKSHRSATANPTITDDGVAGYLPGSRWTNVTGQTDWVCISNATGAAVWKETTNVAGVLGQKAGVVAAATFAGNPKKATVTFGTVFGSAAYSIQLTCGTVNNKAYTPSYESKLAGSFVINMEVNNIADLTEVAWHATLTGESA